MEEGRGTQAGAHTNTYVRDAAHGEPGTIKRPGRGLGEESGAACEETGEDGGREGGGWGDGRDHWKGETGVRMPGETFTKGDIGEEQKGATSSRRGDAVCSEPLPDPPGLA